jgi:hypothetical protein
MGARYIAKAFPMREEPCKNSSREERLAAKLRENLRRRKAQARQIDGSPATQTLPKPPAQG